MKPKLVPDHEGTYINMQRLIQVQGEHVVTGVPARYVMGLIEELNAAKQSERVLREALTLARPVLDDDLQSLCSSFCPPCEVGQTYDYSELEGVPKQWIETTEAALDAVEAALATPAPEQPTRYRLNSGQCAAQVVDCDCRGCRPELEDSPEQPSAEKAGSK